MHREVRSCGEREKGVVMGVKIRGAVFSLALVALGAGIVLGPLIGYDLAERAGLHPERFPAGWYGIPISAIMECEDFGGRNFCWMHHDTNSQSCLVAGERVAAYQRLLRENPKTISSINEQAVVARDARYWSPWYLRLVTADPPTLDEAYETERSLLAHCKEKYRSDDLSAN